MVKEFLHWVFKTKGWRIEGDLPQEIKKVILVAAPHTSNWDFVFGMGALHEYNYDVKYLAKKELFRFPFKRMFLALGGVPVDRSKNNSLVDAMIDLIKKEEKIIVMIPPEGTRKWVRRWRLGFYHVALGANVPIVLGFLDYKKKVAGFGPVIHLSGNKFEDFNRIFQFYKDVNAKFPELFNPHPDKDATRDY
jgi:1-acyl-sn-glycerol-3-phosphate acyltransferase